MNTTNIQTNSPKLLVLEDILREMGSTVVAFSSGVDSTFLLKTAVRILGNNVIAVTAESPGRHADEISNASIIAQELGVEHIIIQSYELDDKNVSFNTYDRCYYCKYKLFKTLVELSVKRGLKFVSDGSNADDDKVYRPGVKALRELNIRSPLKESSLTKNEIRQFSKKEGLSTWDADSQSCLFTRFPYNTEITEKALSRVGIAEQFIKKLGFKNVRVRVYGNTVRIEVRKDQIPELINKTDMIVPELKKAGYEYMTVDLEGYRSGSMDINFKKGSDE